MNLHEAVERYVLFKNENGILFWRAGKYLRNLKQRLGDVPLQELRIKEVIEFLNSPRRTESTFREKHLIVREFITHWVARGETITVQLPLLSLQRRKVRAPYVYNREEVRRLLIACGVLKKRRFKISVDTVRLFIATLYSTGALVEELRTLKFSDVNFKTGYISLITARSKIVRRIPLCQDIIIELDRYKKLSRNNVVKSEYVFHDRRGRQIKKRFINAVFAVVRDEAGLKRERNAFIPRMYDFRATFAIHRLSAWYRSSSNMERLLPALAAYLGVADLRVVERYADISPDRFRSDLQKLSPDPKGRRKHWRDNPALMAYIRSL